MYHILDIDHPKILPHIPSKIMNNYNHCPRTYLLQKSANNNQTKEQGLCDFCWNEYCFCWSEYCLNEWYELQIKHNNLKSKHHTKDKN